MEQIKGERRKCRERCHWISCSITRYRSCVGLSVLLVALVLGTALVCGALQLHLHSSSHSAGTSLLSPGDVKQDSPGCGHRQLRDQKSRYNLYIRKYANLKIKLLSEWDEAPFLQSRQPPHPREITLVTQTSMDRWTHLEKLATSWGGALCVAVHVKTPAEIMPARKKMMLLHDHIEAQHHCRLSLQMVIEEGFESETDALTTPYPVNALRNVALGMATTDLVFLLDIDFVPSPGLHEKLTANENVYSELINRTRNEGQALVVPAFQAYPISGKCPVASVNDPIPQTMQELRERWGNGSATSFRPCYSIAHDSTSYSHFLHPLTKEPYHVQYRELYEPYFIAARALVPKFDERFRGYGKNKVAHAYNCAVQGLNFVVLPEVYVWEIPHPRSEFYHQFKKEKMDPCQGAIMDVLYEVFKEELQTENYQTTQSKSSSNLIPGN